MNCDFEKGQASCIVYNWTTSLGGGGLWDHEWEDLDIIFQRNGRPMDDENNAREIERVEYSREIVDERREMRRGVL